MALSGSFYKNVGSHWRVYCTWSGSQSISGNYTNITLKTYWEARDRYGAVRSSASKSGSASINGSSGSFSFSAKLSGNQRKLVNTRTVRVNHNSDGTKSGVKLSASLGIAVTLSGTYYGNVTASTTVDLNRIPRKSSLTSSRNWTAGSNRTVTVSRASSSFTHKVYIDVQNRSGGWVNIKSLSFSTSASSSFSTAENRKIFEILDGRASANVRWNLHTYSGSTDIGHDTYTGRVTAPNTSSVTITNPTNISSASGQGHNTVYIDQTINISIDRKHSSFTHKLVFKDGNSGSTIYATGTNIGTSLSWTPTSAQRSQMYQKAKNTVEFDGQIDVYTYYDGVQVRSTGAKDINFRVRESANKPSFSSSNISYKDINSTTTGITGNSQYIIQGKSTLQASINTGATGKNHATISKYEVTVNGVTKSRTSIGSINMGAVNASNNVNLTIKAIDSRGFSTSVSKTVNIIPYSPPNISVVADRLNGFENQTTLRVKGTASAIKIGSSNKNSISVARRRYKRATTSTYGSWANLSISGFPSFTASNVNLNLDNLAEWDIQVQISDKLSTVTKNITVPVGRPILYLDADKQSVGIGDFPLYEHEVRVNGRIVFGQNMWASSSQGEGAGALFLNNSDITGVNGIFMNDISNNKGEGIHFLKSGKEEASTSNLDYDTWYIRDGYMYWDNNDFLRYKYGSSAGSAIGLGAGGLTVVGGGESMKEVMDTLREDLEELHLASDGNLLIHSNMQNGWDSRYQWAFRGDGNMSAPGHINVAGRVNSGSNLRMNGYNTIENLNDRLYLDGKKGVSIRYPDGDARLDFNNDGKPNLQSMTIYNRTYSGGANMYITEYGTLGRSTSASKYKLNIKEAETDEIAERILALHPKKWHDKSAVEQYAEYMTKIHNGEDIGDMDIPYLETHYGLVAEDLVDVGLEMFVQYGEPNEDGVREVEGIEYDRVWTMLIPIVRNQRDEIKRLEARISSLEKSHITM